MVDMTGLRLILGTALHNLSSVIEVAGQSLASTVATAASVVADAEFEEEEEPEPHVTPIVMAARIGCATRRRPCCTRR